MKLEDWVQKIGKNIREERKKLGLTQEKLAEIADVDTSYIGQIERGLQTPSLKILWRISEGMNIHMFILLQAESKEVPEEILEEFSALLLNLPYEQQRKILEVIKIVISMNSSK